MELSEWSGFCYHLIMTVGISGHRRVAPWRGAVVGPHYRCCRRRDLPDLVGAHRRLPGLLVVVFRNRLFGRFLDDHCREAITNCRITVIKRSALMALAARDHEAARQISTLTARELQRVREHSLALIKSAAERVAGIALAVD